MKKSAKKVTRTYRQGKSNRSFPSKKTPKMIIPKDKSETATLYKE